MVLIGEPVTAGLVCSNPQNKKEKTKTKLETPFKVTHISLVEPT